VKEPDEVVVLDTSVIDDDPRLMSARCRLLLDGAPEINALIVLPAVVVEELKHRTSDKVADSLRKIAAERQKVRFLTGDPFHDDRTPRDDERLAQSVYGWYHAHWFYNPEGRDPPILIAKHPQISHEDLARRAVHKRKPFKKDGQGYQDALIWHTVLECAERYPRARIALATRNTNDFLADDRKSLHADLIEELAARGLDGRVTPYASIEEFNSARMLPRLRDETAVRFEVEREDTIAGRALRAWLCANRLAITLRQLEGTAIMKGRTDHTTDRLSPAPIATAVRRVTSKQSRVLGDTEVAIELDVECTVAFTVERSPAEIRFPNVDGTFQLMRYESLVHNDEEDVRLGLNVIMRSDTRAVIAADVTEIAGRYGMAWFDADPNSTPGDQGA
jgi:hypothetical protein